MTVKFLSLKGGWAGLSEVTLVKMPHCWKSHVTAQLSSCKENENSEYPGQQAQIFVS